MYFKDFWHLVTNFGRCFKYFFSKRKSDSFLHPSAEVGRVNENSIHWKSVYKYVVFYKSYFLKNHYNWWHSHKQLCILLSVTAHKANTRCSLGPIRYWNRKFTWNDNTYRETNSRCIGTSREGTSIYCFIWTHYNKTLMRYVWKHITN